MKNGSTKQLMLWFYDSVVKPASRSIFRFYAKRYGAAMGLVYVGGYPKSGTTWISKMVAHYLGLPWVGHTDIAFGFPAVVHHHWDYQPAFDRSILVLRDGRDVMVSIYMNMVKGYLAVEESLSELGRASPGRVVRSHVGRHANLRRRFRYLYGTNFDPWDTDRNLPKFIESEMKEPFIPEAKTPWPRYVSAWMDRAKQVTCVKYEDMLDQPGLALKSLLRAFDEEPKDEDISYVVRRFSFARMTGRMPGVEDRRSFARKGVSGDWRNHFSLEARQVFDHYAGDVLIRLGYEVDHHWAQASEGVSDADSGPPGSIPNLRSRAEK